jgi:hypothetical protein
MDNEIIFLQTQLNEILQANFALGKNIEETQFKISLNNDIIEKNKNMLLQLQTLDFELHIKNKF